MINNYNLNIRQMQAYAAICLLIFCNHVGIKHVFVNQLIKHLLAVLTTNSLPNWEQEGASLAITGRGDPLPIEIDQVIQKEYKILFNSLVESCVEIGIADMYGASTEHPKIFFEKCVNDVQQFGLKLPSVEKLNRLEKGEDSWGEAIDEAEFKKFIDEYDLNLS